MINSAFYSSYSSWKYLPRKNDARMNVCHACTVGYIRNRHLFYCQRKVHKVMDIKEVFLKCKNKRLH